MVSWNKGNIKLIQLQLQLRNIDSKVFVVVILTIRTYIQGQN